MIKSFFKEVFLLLVLSVIIGCVAYVPNPPEKTIGDGIPSHWDEMMKNMKVVTP